MTSDEFAKIFYIEKLNFLKSCFEEKLKEVIDTLLTDVFYSILLGLDGENSIGNTPIRLTKYTIKKAVSFPIVGN